MKERIAYWEGEKAEARSKELLLNTVAICRAGRVNSIGHCVNNVPYLRSRDCLDRGQDCVIQQRCAFPLLWFVCQVKQSIDDCGPVFAKSAALLHRIAEEKKR
ncbi:MAG: hypothetical protein ACRD5F_07385 [Candidatus Acidiferrales bacterium]